MYQCSSSDIEDYYTIKMQPDQGPHYHDLPATPMMNYCVDVDVPAIEVNVWGRLCVGTRHSLGPFL